MPRLDPALTTGAAFPRVSVAALVLANFVPLAGVLFMGWTVGGVMLVFWLENAIIGFFNALRMILATKGGVARQLEKVMAVPFFCVHYGMFTFVHGVFVLAMFVQGKPLTESHRESSGPAEGNTPPTPAFEESFNGSPDEVVLGVMNAIVDSGLWWAVASLVLSHGISFFVNYIGRGEFTRVTAQELMMRPYGRVVVLHIVILAGGAAIMATGEPRVALVMLVLLKIGVDIAAHRHEHKKLAEQGVPA